MTEYFRESYEECRCLFLEVSHSVGGAEVKSHPINDLMMDVVFLPALKPSRKLLILSSGLHGIEGYLGSALQTYSLAHLPREDMNCLLLHGINPYGFKHGLRVTENNVDLNRHLSQSSGLFETRNPAYEEIDEFLNPKSPANCGPLGKLSFFVRALRLITRSSLGTVRRGMLAGQYSKPEGIFFGGKKPEPQRDLLQEILSAYSKKFSEIFHLDLHTGYGKRGNLHVLSGGKEHSSSFSERVFQDVHVEYGQEEDFYEISGGFVDFSRSIFTADKNEFAGAYLEFGTLNGDTLLGNLEMAYRMIRENQYRRFGGDERVKLLFREMFYPSDPKWRQRCLTQFSHTLHHLCTNFSRL